MVPNGGDRAVQALAHHPNSAHEAKRVLHHPAKEGSGATWGPLCRGGDAVGPSVPIAGHGVLQRSLGVLEERGGS